MALNSNALTDYATVAADLGLSGSTDQSLIERFINVASGAISRFTMRDLEYQATVTESVALPGGPKLLLQRTPIVLVTSIVVTQGADPIDPSEWYVYDAEVGIIWRDAGWPWSAQFRPDLNFTRDQMPGLENKVGTVVYSGGYITSPQAYGAAAWPGATTAVVLGTLARPSAHTTQLWMATVAGTSGGTEPSWPSSPSVGATITDGGVTWTYQGTAGSTGSAGTAVTLPPELEEAAIITTKAMYRERKDNPNVTREGLLGVTQEVSRDWLPRQAQALAMPFKRWM